MTFVGLLIYASVIYHRYKKGTLSRSVPSYGQPAYVQPGGEHLIPNNNNYPQPTQVYHNGYPTQNGYNASQNGFNQNQNGYNQGNEYNSAPIQKPAFYGSQEGHEMGRMA